MGFSVWKQIDVTVIPFMEDNILSQYVPFLGDRVALRQFCRQHNRPSGSRQQGSSRKHLLLEQLREKLKKRRTSDDEQSSDEGNRSSEKKPKNVGNKHACKSSRIIRIGWKNIAPGGHLMQVQGSRGGGTRNIRMSLTATKTDIVSEAKKLFFPNGTSSLGCESEFKFDVIDVRCQVIDNSMTIGCMYETMKPAGSLQFYMTTAQLSGSSLQLDSSPTSPVCFFNIVPFTYCY